jgi:hypothetical protein
LKRQHEYWIGYAALACVVACVILLFFLNSEWLLLPMCIATLVAIAMVVAPETKYVKWTRGGKERVLTDFWARFGFGLLVSLLLIPSFALDLPLKLFGRNGFVEWDDDGFYSINVSGRGFEKRNHREAA